jgi:hypothetical protein
MLLLGDVSHVQSHFFPFGDSVSVFFLRETVLVLVQDRCTVCAIRTIGSALTLDTPNGTPR